MQYDEVHFENAKGHAVVLLKNAEKALEECNREYAGWSLNDAHSYLTTMRNEAYNDGAPDAVRAKYEEIASRYNAAKEALEKQETAAEQEAALIRFDAECDRVEGLLDDYAGELAENHSESYGTENAIFCKLAKKLEERRELLQDNALDARWRRVERLKERFHNLKRLGVIARRYWSVQD